MTTHRASLDDPADIAAVDRSGMLEAVAGLGGQLQRGFELGNGAPARFEDGPTATFVCGMGGSGIAGDVVRGLLGERRTVLAPILVTKGYGLPSSCRAGSLLIAVSYSGNTEETLEVYRLAVERGADTVAISAGGRLREVARARSGVHVQLPDDAPMPRAALGYLAGAILGCLAHEEVSSIGSEIASAAQLLAGVSSRWQAGIPTERNEAKAAATWLGDRTPHIWGSEGLMEAVALRWKNQLNENAKTPAFWSILPELDHNEVEGWSPETAKEYAVVALRHDGEHPRVAERFEATKDAASEAGLEVREVHAEGESSMERLFSLVMLGDFVSTYLAILRGTDPTPVPTLTALKHRLGR